MYFGFFKLTWFAFTSFDKYFVALDKRVTHFPTFFVKLDPLMVDKCKLFALQFALDSLSYLRERSAGI